MSKTLCLFVMLSLLSSLTHASRPDPSISVKDAGVEFGIEEASCVGEKKDECLMSKTLDAHIDYIYTQEQKPHHVIP
ncbi:hypothetical protein ACJIZ3_025090 [Penstemon smallii]|uniref:Phytosulfokine n=1 Tax=Penstemon smallii TaxID=265156 RepID=A0ABD3TTQ8_9LAMI